jgi:DMSO/TMAO reductase YedYZ molybdopterin-dependent catalytic subunit
LPLVRLAAMIALCAVASCSRRPSDAKLDALRKEAEAANAERLAAQPAAADPAASWEVHVTGAVKTPLRLAMKPLALLATIDVKTRTPENTQDFSAILDYRVVPLSTLLAKAGAKADATTVTLVATDAFRATVDIADLAKWPEIGLAVSLAGKPISRTQGGPVQLVFPYTTYADLEAQYGGRYWSWYVTDVIVGTEAPHVTIGQRTFDAAALDALPQVTLDEEVHYKVNWPSAAVKLRGVRLRDVLAAAGVPFPDGAKVIVRGKAQIDHDAAQPTGDLEAVDVRAHDIILATHWGDDDAPIPARLGGPVTLALPPDCATKYGGEKRWITFVEGVDVK